jgi:hypothetical protein
VIATERRILAAMQALADAPVRVPVIGGPPKWKWFPKPRQSHGLRRGSTLAWMTQRKAVLLWSRHFIHEGRAAPSVSWSFRMKVADARCYHWGIVISWYRYVKVRRSRREAWIHKLLLHELLHHAGYGHDQRFRAAAKRLGTW